MRMISILLFALLLLGCSHTVEKKFNVSMLDASSGSVFVAEKNKTLDRISFVMQNNEEFALDCSVLLTLDNVTNSSSLRGAVGMLNPGEGKKVSLSFEMLSGQASMKIIPECRH